MSRRNFLLATGSLTGLTLAQARLRPTLSFRKYSGYPFSLGVASGDPMPDSVVLWTRLAPNPLRSTSMPPVNVPVMWQIATDEKMGRVVAKGEAIATPELAHSIRVVVNGLESDRWYWYQFKAGKEISPIGRTKTAPNVKDILRKLTFAFVSCQNYEHGYFNAYSHLAEEDLDFVLHLGDYIYEYAPKANSNHPRQHIGQESTDLETYRQRYGLYKSDPDLQAAHAAFPFICTWDDREVDNDYANGESQDFDPVEKFLIRRAAAYQAYYEHLPLRPVSRPYGPYMRLYRRFSYGQLAQFSLLDSRQYRSDQVCDNNGRGGGQLIAECPDRFDRDRTLLGSQQESWLFEGLARSPFTWNVVAQQTLVAQLKQKLEDKTAYWSDGWDGYPLSRRKILEFISQHRPSNPVFIGGDIHSFWVTDLKTDFDDRNSPVVASEFVGTSISSNGVPYERFASYLKDNPHVKFFESRLRGYVKCTADRKKWTSDLRVVNTVKHPRSTLQTLASFVVENGKTGAQQV